MEWSVVLKPALVLVTGRTGLSRLNANNFSITGAQDVSAVSFTGNLTGLVHNIDVRTIGDKLVDVDLGTFTTVNNVLDLIIVNFDFDLGTYTTPSSMVIDGGSM